jgi:hypothetical protein
VTLSDTGNALMNISSIAISATYSNIFAQTNNCGSSLAVGANCTISVTFAPYFETALTGSLVITDNAAGSPQTVSLSGTGIPSVTPPGSYPVQVNAQSGGDQHSIIILVTVQ